MTSSRCLAASALVLAMGLGAVAPLRAEDGLQLIQKLEPIGRDRFFGRCVAAVGDLLVVSSGARTGGNGSGAVYVYRRTEGKWELQERIQARGAPPRARFGRGCDTDGTRVIAGAPGEKIEGGTLGAAYVFKSVGESWIEEARLVPGDGIGTNFGRDVAIHGDNVAVGAPREADSVGSAYAFRFSDGEWHSNGKPSIVVTDDKERIGLAVDLHRNHLIVGSDSSLGILRPFQLSEGEWLPQSTIRRVFGQEPERFGSVLAVRGKRMVSGSGIGALSTGVPIFRRRVGVWERETYLRAGDQGKGIQFGRSVALGARTAVVGAIDFLQEDERFEIFGAAYVFRLQQGNWVRTEKLFTTQESFSDFGSKVAVAGRDVVVSDPLERGARKFSGAVYIYR